jgi:hypothetical protein
MALRNLILLSVVLMGCDRAVAPSSTFEPLRGGFRNLYAVATDFTTGAVYRIDLEAGKVSETVLPAHADASARFAPEMDRLVVVNRLAGSHLTVSTPDLTQVIAQFALPATANPQDLLPVGGSQAWVSFLKGTHLQRVDLLTGEVRGQIDLGEWADSDGFAEAAYWHRRGDTAWVCLQRLDAKYQPAGSGYVLPIDLARGEVDRARVVEIAYRNPFTEIKPFGDKLCLGAAGTMNRTRAILDGAIECWSDAGGVPQPLIWESMLGGDLLDFDIAGPNAALAIVGRPQTDLVFFDPGNPSAVRGLRKGDAYQFSHLLADPVRRVWYVADRSSENPGIRVFGWDGVEWEKSRIPLALPPFRLVSGN